MHDDRGRDSGVRRRPQRRDAVRNRESLVAGALRVLAREGLSVPLAEIAKEAGVGNATFYRSFPDRHALMVELEHRAYETLIGILQGIADGGETGLGAVQSFLESSVLVADELILPLHGAPPLVDDEAVAKRRQIDAQIESFLEQARRAGTVRDDVNATDIIMCSALITQPLSQGPDWSRSAARHIALFVAGIASEGPLPEVAVRQYDIKLAFRARAESVSSAES